MSDQKQKGAKIDISFLAGETITASKLNAMVNTIYKSLTELEKAVGDYQNRQSPYDGDIRLSNSVVDSAGLNLGAYKDLNISSLARLIGPAEMLNSIDDSSNQVTETLSNNKNVIYLTYVSIEEGSFVINNDPDSCLLSEKILYQDMVELGDYKIDYEKGILYTISPLTSDVNVTYNVNSFPNEVYSFYRGAGYNVIPSPDQTTKCSATLDGDDTIISLPLSFTSAYNIDESDTDLFANDLMFEKQLELPAILQDQLSLGDVIPENFIIVLDLTSNRVLDNITIVYETESSIRILNENLDVGHEYQLMTVATNITSTLSSLNKRLMKLRTGLESVARLNPQNIGIHPEGTSVPSYIDDNPMPQYLHRSGYHENDNGPNKANGLYGELLMLAATVGSTDDFIHLEDHSQPIALGKPEGIGPYIRYEKHTGRDGIYFRKGSELSSATMFFDSQINTPSVGFDLERSSVGSNTSNRSGFKKLIFKKTAVTLTSGSNTFALSDFDGVTSSSDLATYLAAHTILGATVSLKYDTPSFTKHAFGDYNTGALQVAYIDYSNQFSVYATNTFATTGDLIIVLDLQE